MGKDLKTWEDYLLFVEFSYNRSIHSSTGYSSFEIIYGFNPLIVLDLSPLSLIEITSLYRKPKAKMVRSIHEKVK